MSSILTLCRQILWAIWSTTVSTTAVAVMVYITPIASTHCHDMYKGNHCNCIYSCISQSISFVILWWIDVWVYTETVYTLYEPCVLHKCTYIYCSWGCNLYNIILIVTFYINTLLWLQTCTYIYLHITYVWCNLCMWRYGEGEVHKILYAAGQRICLYIIIQNMKCIHANVYST